MTELIIGIQKAFKPGVAARTSRVALLIFTCLLLSCASAVAQIRMAIEISPNEPVAGELVIVRVTVVNAGVAMVDNLRAEVEYPAGLAAMSDMLFSDGGDCTFLTNGSACNEGETAFWEIGSLSPGAGKTVYMTPTVAGGTPADLLIAFNGEVLEGASLRAVAGSEVVVVADRALELEVDADREPVAPGKTLGFELNFGNQSGTATTSTELRFPLPADTSLVGADGGGALVGNEVVWNIGILNPGDSGKRRVTVQLGGALGDGDLVEVDSAEISGESGFEIRRTRQQATTRVETASQLAFSIDMPAQPLRTNVASPIHLTVTNRGATVRSGVRAELFFPPGLADMSDALFSDGGDCTFLTNSTACDGGETAFWDIGTLPPGAGKTVTLSPAVLSASADGRVLSFFGRAFAEATPDFWQRRSLALEADRALELEVDADHEPVAPGDKIHYELTFGNRGFSATAATELRFPLPAGTSFVEADGGGTLVANEVIWDIGTLNPGDSGKRRVAVQLEPALENGDLVEVDSAEISGESGFEIQRTRQQATTRVETASQLAFSIDMPAQPLRTNVASPIHLTVTNRGATVQSGVRAELFFPPGLADMSDALFSDGGDCTFLTGSTACDGGETAFWDIGTLPPGVGKTLTMVPSALLTNGDGRVLSFFGRAFANSTPDFWQRRSLALEADRALELEVDPDREPVASGGTLGYTLSFGNAGSTATTGTELRFPLPDGASLVVAEDGGLLDGNDVLWNLGTLDAGDVGRRRVELALDASSVAGDIVRGRSPRLAVKGSTMVSNDTHVRLRPADDFDFTLSLFPNIGQPEQPMAADLVVFNQAPFDITNVNLGLYFPAALIPLGDASISDGGDCSFVTSVSTCNPGESVIWQLGTMPGSSQLMRMLEPTLANIAQGTLVNFFARIRSDSTSGAFVKRTLPVGNFAPPPPPPDPAISVSGNGIEIVNGDTTPSPSDGTDFGSADFDGETITRNFTVENSNTGDLEISSVSITGTNSLDFLVVFGPAPTIGPSEQSILAIRFDPDTIGTRTATVSITSNDTDASPYTFDIQGQGEDASGELLFRDGFE